jgi:hypothetical protein
MCNKIHNKDINSLHLDFLDEDIDYNNSYSHNLNGPEIETDDDELSCYGDIQKTSQYIKLFYEYNNSIQNQCNIYNIIQNKKLYNGSTGMIYSFPSDPTKLIKISNMPYETHKFIESRKNSGIICNEIDKKIFYSINEVRSSLLFSKLNKVFPHNIMKIFNSEQCKYDNNVYFSNAFIIENVRGITFDKLFENISLVSDHNFMLICTLQLLYVTLYANINGYYHNDLKFNNIIIDINSGIFELYYDTITINQKKIILHIKNKFSSSLFVPIVKLIDFGTSLHYKSDKIIIGETFHIIDKIINKLAQLNIHNDYLLKIKQLLNQLITDDLDDLLNEENIGAIDSIIGFRLLSYEEIQNMNQSVTFDNIFNALQEIKNFINLIRTNISMFIIDESDHRIADIYKHNIKINNGNNHPLILSMTKKYKLKKLNKQIY